MSQLSFSARLKTAWQVLLGKPTTHVSHYKDMRNVRITVDWAARRLSILGEEIRKATDYEEVWINHIIRLNENNVHNIEEDQL